MGETKRIQTRPLDPAVARVVRAQMRETGTPGVAVGVFHKGRAQGGGFGVTSLDAPAPVRETTIFQIGSTTKTFTATAVMRLVEQGVLELDVPIRRYLRGLQLRDPDVARRVTLRHLLTHTGGWVGDYFEDTGRGDDALARIVHNLRNVPQLTPLGTVWHYNNAGFYLAGRVMEQATGKPFEVVVRELLLDPLGMTRTFFFAEEAIVYQVAAGHQAVKGRKHVVAKPWALGRAVGPAGTILSDVVDQLRWAQFNLGDGRAPDGKRLLKRSSMREMTKSQAPAGNIADSVGLSWLIEDIDGVRTVAHGGTTNGQLSAFLMVPDEDFAVTVLTNSTRGGEVHKAIVEAALSHYLGVRRTRPKPLSVNGSVLGQYEGTYIEGLKTVALDVTPTARTLTAQYRLLKDDPEAAAMVPPAFTISLFDEDRGIVTNGRLQGTRVEFLRSSRGRLRWLRVGGRLLRLTPAKR